jgi:putative two-component system response regulator
LLIVDDDPISREMLAGIMEDEGFEVELAENGAQAWDHVRKGKIRMVISDWEMPEMDGLALCRRIRQTQLPGYVYFLLVTRRSNLEDVITGLSAGADDLITKPYHPAELKVRVRGGLRLMALESRELTIFAMAKLVESRDSDAGNHLERMQRTCRLLSEHMAGRTAFAHQIDEEFVQTIELTCLLHDIGKVGIPDSILLKPGRLNDDEFKIMKTHTTIGADTLEAALCKAQSKDYLKMGRDIAMAHHEHYDGSGYPHGLAGKDIPLAARIVALADAYDALVSKRVYRNALNHVMARNIIVQEAGTHFDPSIVEAFVACEEQFVGMTH